jgi:hypothetical protein
MKDHITIHGTGVAVFKSRILVDGRFEVQVTLAGRTISGKWPGPKMGALQKALRHWDDRYKEAS